MVKKQKTLDSQLAYQLGKDLENWPTRQADLELAGEILVRHQEKYGAIKFFEICELDEKNERFTVVFPWWFHELTTRLNAIYGREDGEVVLNKILRWLMRATNASFSLAQ